MNKLWQRLRVLFRRGEFDRELEEEMQFHLEMQAREIQEEGATADEARHAARRRFGNQLLLEETSRAVWGWGPLDRLFQDGRYALRLLRRSPGFTAVAVLSLGLGIGVNAAIFRILDNLLLRPLPVPQSDRLASLQHRAASSNLADSMSFPDYLYYREHNQVFTALAAHSPVQVTVRDGDRNVRVDGEIVSANYFAMLGVHPALGRWFFEREDKVAGAGPVVVLGYGFWRRYFGRDNAVLGKQLTINRHPFTVIGVAPDGFAGLPAGVGVPHSEFWVPVSEVREIIPELGPQDMLHCWGNTWVLVTGRVKPGLSIAQAEASLRPLSDQLRGQWIQVWGAMSRAWPDNPSGWTAALLSESEARIAPEYRQTLNAVASMLVATVVLVLLMACLNVAGLLLTNALKRQREFAVRLSLGAARGRIIRQLLVECLMLASGGCAAGLLLARWTSAFLVSYHLPFLPAALDAGIDAHVLVFAIVVSTLCAIATGVVPALRASTCDLATAMKGDATGSLSGARKAGLRSAIVAGQVALAVVLLVGAGLFIRTLQKSRAADITVDPGHVLLTPLNLEERGYDEQRGQLFYSGLLERIQSIPGVKSAALVMVVPLGGWRGGNNIKTAEGDVQVDFNIVSPKYFETIGMPVARGRAFTDHDRAGSPPVVMINEPFARRFFPGQDPIGKAVQLTSPGNIRAEVIGIVRDGPFQGVRARVQPCYYASLSQQFSPNMALEVRTIGDPATFATPVRQAILAVDKDFPVEDMLTLESHREAGLAQERLITTMLTGFAALAVILAVIGIYGVISLLVARRTREIGLRMALGANQRAVAGLLLRRGLMPVFVGLGIGLFSALSLTRFASSLLFGVTPSDPPTFIAISILVVAASAGACLVPARRASRIDPMEALRYE